MSKAISRRTYLTRVGGTAAAMSAVSYKRVIGANERISIGMIGCGQRGFEAHMQGIHQHDSDQNVRFTAVCDPWTLPRERAAQAVSDWYGIKARQFESYQDLIALKDVDAVMIASCDHQHTVHLAAAARAGKDVYVEKPLGLDFHKVRQACDAVREARVVCQVGTQLRSEARFSGCRALYQTGILGAVTRIEQRRNSNQPYWYKRLPNLDTLKEHDVNWKEFLTGRPNRPFDPVRYTGWYGFRDYTDGPIANLGCHFIDLVHYITGAQYPESCVCQGGIFTWRDEYNFTCHDQVQALWTYPEGFMVSYSTNFGNSGDSVYLRIHGDRGSIRSEGKQLLYSGQGGIRGGDNIRNENPVLDIEQPDHFLDWLQCMRTRRQPLAPIEAGYQHTLACLMAVQSCDSGKRMLYDATKREIFAG